MPTSSSLADALLAVAEAFLAGKAAAADDPEVYQVIVHVGTGALSGTGAEGGGAAADVPAGTVGVSAETPAAGEVPGHPANPARCHVEDGTAISVSTAQMLTCTAALSWMLHDRDGAVLDLGRRRRRPNAALRRAARERDHCRCRFPGCESRRIDLHHIQHWINGGRTSLTNLISLCPYHHKLVHDRGYLITAAPGDTFAFFRPDGTGIPPSPALPQPDGTIDSCHDAAHHPRDDHPAVVRRAPRPGPRYLHLPGQRPHPARTAGPAQPGRRPRTVPAHQMGHRTSRLDPAHNRAHRRLTAGLVRCQ